MGGAQVDRSETGRRRASATVDYRKDQYQLEVVAMVDWAKMTTMGLSLDANGDIWRYQGAFGMTKIAEVGPGQEPIPVLGPVNAMNQGDVLTIGWWILVDRTVGIDPASLLESDGTTQMPFDGEAYTLTFTYA